MTTGEKIRQLRIENNMTLEELGDKIGVGKSTVRKWETGMIENMRRDKIAKLADVFHVQPEYLINDEETIANSNITNYTAYLDDETQEIAIEISNNSGLRTLFNIARNSTPEKIRAYAAFLKSLNNEDK